jgi:hypothetical protein
MGGLIGGMARLARDAARAFVRSLLNSVPRRLRRFVGFAQGGVAGFAAGGVPTPTDAFAGAPTRKSTGGRHSRPTYLVGEENRPEFVIATNPAYRKANLEYLSMAAAALKAPMVPAFAGAGFAKGGTVDADDRQAFAKGGRRGGGRKKRRGGGRREVNPAWMRWLGGRVGGAAREPDDNALTSAERAFSMWQSRYDLSEEEFVRNGVLSKPDIARRARELDSLIGRMRQIIAVLQRRSRLGGRNLGTLAWARRELSATKRDLRGGPTGPVTALDEEYGEAAKRWREITRSSPFDIFEARTNLMGLRQERAQLAPRNWAALLAEGGGGSSGGGDDGYQQRQIERLTAELQTARVQHGQLGVTSDFAAQYVGRYAQGGPVRSTGLAYVHRGEHVSPAPNGGYGSQLRPQVNMQPVVKVYIEGDQGALTKRIRAEVDGRSAPVVSQQLGRRTRRIASAPGARRPTYAR